MMSYSHNFKNTKIREKFKLGKKISSISKKIMYGTLIGVLFVNVTFAYNISTPRVAVGSFLTKSLWDLLIDDLWGLMMEMDTNNANISTNTANIATNTANIGANVPTGAVMHFNLSSCPSGWSSLVAAEGRYMVGLPSGGSLGASVGNALTNLENREVGRHTHVVNDPGHAHGIEQIVGTGGVNWGISRNPSGTTFNDSSTESTGIVLSNTGDINGTNAPYLQLLVCEKD